MTIQTSVSSMAIGDTIICEYVAASGAAGTFSNLGTSTAALLSTTPPAAPNGAFYFIYVGDDASGRKVLVADRNVQSSITWNTLNAAGFTSFPGTPTTLAGSSFYIRIPTGGVDFTNGDVYNEWKTFIVDSRLNNTVAAGDNAVWNYNTAYSWTTSNDGHGATYRTTRGSTVSGHHAFLTTDSGASIGFRPILVTNPTPSRTYFYLIQDGTAIKAYNGSAWQSVGTAPVTEAMFTSSGMTSLGAVNDAALNLLSSTSFTILRYTVNEPSFQHTTVAHAVPSAKLVISNTDLPVRNITSLNSVSLAATEAGGGVIRVIVSLDSGTTWKAWNGSAWATVDTSALANVKAGGMPPATLDGLTTAQLNSLFAITPQSPTPTANIRFGYYLELAATSDVASVDSLTFNINMSGIWSEATPGTDFTYGYSDSETLRVTLMANGDFKIDY